MSNLYDLALFPAKSVIKSLHKLERTTMEAAHKSQSVTHEKNEKIIKCHEVRIRLVISYNVQCLKHFLT